MWPLNQGHREIRHRCPNGDTKRSQFATRLVMNFALPVGVGLLVLA
jgi:hypothetical protein